MAAPAVPDGIEYPPLSEAAKKAGVCTIIGFGSLLSEKSCRFTFSTVLNFRPGSICGWRRVFGHVAPIFLERGIANVETKEMSSLSVEPAEETVQMRVSVFEIPIEDLPAFYLREMEFRWLHTSVYTPQGLSRDEKAIDGQGLLCARYSDPEYREVRLRGDKEAYQQAFGRWGIEQIWRDDILPCRTYLRHVVLAAAGMDLAFGTTWPNQSISWEMNGAASKGTTHETPKDAPPIFISPTYVSLPRGDILSSFLDTTFLGDRKTTIREYLGGRRGDEIMCTQPPEALKQRYNG